MKHGGFYFWAIIYKVTLEVVYTFWVAPIYGYSGLIWEPNLLYFFVSYGLFFILLIFLPKNQEKPSSQLGQLFFFTTIVPLLSFMWQADKSPLYILWVFCCCLLLFILLRVSKPIRLVRLDSGRKKTF